MKENDVLDNLYAAADSVYKDFNSSLIPSVDKSSFVGVRTPQLREMAKDMIANGCWRDFISNLPHNLFEENQLHAFILSELADFDFVVRAVDKFLPYVDNWATCDQMSPKVFAKNTEKLFPFVQKWIKSKKVYTVRFAVLVLMKYFMDKNFDTKYVDMVVQIKSNEYYVNMMQAWYFATAAAKHFDMVFPYFEKLGYWTCMKAIQKATESYRVTGMHKLQLKRLKKRIKK